MSHNATVAAPAAHVDLARWPTSSPASVPRDGEIHLWSIDLNPGRAEIHRLGRILSREERERAARFRFERDRHRYLTCRGALRLLIGRYLETSPERIRFRVGPWGKPELADPLPAPSFHFNVSHSGVLALAAIRSSHEVGVDIEQILAGPDLPEVATRVFSAVENAELGSLPGALWASGFYRGWTAKEAVIKCTGEGLAHPLDSFDVVMHPHRPAALLRWEGGSGVRNDWTLDAFEPAAGFVGTVACRGDTSVVCRRHFRPFL